MSTHRKSLIRQVLDRLDEYMAIGESCGFNLGFALPRKWCCSLASLK